MVLQAAYMHPILRPMVLEVITFDNFRTLLTTTLAFINLHATKSSALHADWKILDATSQKNGLRGSYLPSNASSSFSSNSGDYPMSGR